MLVLGHFWQLHCIAVMLQQDIRMYVAPGIQVRDVPSGILFYEPFSF